MACVMQRRLLWVSWWKCRRCSYIIDHFCDEVDFFSIGSNDMTQYLYAVDRNNPRVSPLYNPITPSFLRMLQQIVTTAHQRGKWVGICGELGGESRYLPLLLGLGWMS